MGSLSYPDGVKRTPVPDGAGCVKAITLNSDDASSKDGTHFHCGSLMNAFSLVGYLTDEPNTGNLSGSWQARPGPGFPWTDISTFSKAEFNFTTSAGANTGWFEHETVLSGEAPGPEFRCVIDSFLATGPVDATFWMMWAPQA